MQFFYLINDLGIFGSSYTNTKQPALPTEAANEPILDKIDPNNFIIISFLNNLWLKLNHQSYSSYNYYKKLLIIYM